MQFDKDIPKDKLLIKIFRFVQNIPYRITPFDSNKYACKEPVTTSLKQGDCRHKSLLLHNLLLQNNFEVKKYKTIFDWKDLPIPKEILNTLQKSGTRWSHDIVGIGLNKYSISYIDPTWNSELERLGFPVTGAWDGKESTKQITREKLEYLDAENFKEKDHGIIIDKAETQEFTKTLNEWLDKSS